MPGGVEFVVGTIGADPSDEVEGRDRFELRLVEVSNERVVGNILQQLDPERPQLRRPARLHPVLELDQEEAAHGRKGRAEGGGLEGTRLSEDGFVPEEDRLGRECLSDD